MNFLKGSQTTLLVVALISLAIGFLIGNASSGLNLKKAVTIIPEESLFDSQSAIVKGKVTSVDGQKISVTTSGGKNGQLSLSDNVRVNKILNGKNKRPQATSSADLNTVELNKLATIYLQNINGNYVVLSINMDPPAPIEQPLPPLPKR